MVAEAALKAKVDTNLFGDVASQLGLDAEGAAGFLDQLTAASQGTGVDIDILTRTIGKSSARWQAAGGDMDDLAATVIKAADEFGPSGLRGAMSEIMQEVDKGLIPSVASLEKQLGDTTGAVERTYEASKTWRDTLRETKDAALAYIGPAGDMLGVLGSTASGLALAGPQMLKWIKGLKLAAIAQKAFNLAMRLNPIGLIVTAIGLVGLAIYKWRDKIWGFLKGAWDGLVSGLLKGYNAIAKIVPGMKEVEVASRTSFEPAVTSVADATAELALDAEAASEALSGGGPSLVASLGETATAADDAAIQIDAYATMLEELGRAEASLLLTQPKLKLSYDDLFTATGNITRGVDAFSLSLEYGEPKILKQIDLLGDLKDAAAPPDSGGWFSSITGGFKDMLSGITGGGGIGGMLEGIGAGITQGIGNLISGGLASITDLALKGIISLGKKLGGWIKSIFGGPSEAELAARETFAGFHKGAVEALGGTQRYADEVQRAIDDGWDRTLAETRAGFILMGTDMGKTYDEAFADYERYQKAVGEGNTELMKQIEAEYAEWRDASADTAKDVKHDAAEIGRQFQGLTATEAAELGTALIGLGSKANKAFTDIHDSAIAAGNALANDFLPHILSVSRAISNIPRNVTIRINTIETTKRVDIPKRQHGGPVSAGRPYLVGEAGPEVFMPSSSGSVAANKSLPTAEEIGAAVAAALHRVPLVVPQDAVTDSILRRTPNRQALRGWA